jgi:hypothetical protein
MDYTAQGQTVGLAARMEQIAAPDRVCLTPATAELVNGFFELRDLGGARIKGCRSRSASTSCKESVACIRASTYPRPAACPRATALQEAHALFTALGASLPADVVAGRLSS